VYCEKTYADPPDLLLLLAFNWILLPELLGVVLALCSTCLELIAAGFYMLNTTHVT